MPVFVALWSVRAYTDDHGPKAGSEHLCEHHKCCRIAFGKMPFSPLLEHSFRPKMARLQGFLELSEGPNRSPRAPNGLKALVLSTSSGRGPTLGKFSPRGTPVGPTLAPVGSGSVRRLGRSCTLVQGPGVLQGDEVSKPQNVGDCGWARCPWNRFFEPNRLLSHVAQDGGHSRLFGRRFWGILGLPLRHMIELEASKGFFDTTKSSRSRHV